MKINERLSLIRSELKLTTRSFGERINLSGGLITNMEKGRRAITDRTITDICREFRVNETWLRTGEGDMFIKVPIEIIDQLAYEYNLQPLAKKIVEMFVTLEDDEMNAVMSKIKKVIKNISDNETSATQELDEPLPQIELIKPVPDESKPVIINGVELSPEDSKMIRNYWSNQQIKENNQEQQPKSKWDIETDRVIELALLQKEIDKQYNNPIEKERLSS